MVVKAKKATTLEEAKNALRRSLSDGSAFATFCRFVEAQGGNAAEAKNPDLLPKAKYVEPVDTVISGYVNKIDTEKIGRISLLLGGGRETKESSIDLSVGLVLQKKRGDLVKAGETLAFLHANDKIKLEQARKLLLEAYHICEQPPEEVPLIHTVIE